MARRLVVFHRILSISVFLCVLPFSVNCKVNLNDELLSGNYDFIDLSHPFDDSTVYWPGAQQFEFTRKTEIEGEDHSWYAANDFKAGEHGGTHLDAPYHFNRTGIHAGEIPLTKLIVSLIIVDVSSIVNDDPNFVLHKHHLDYLLNNNMGKPCVLIFKFGWSKHYSNSTKYLGYDDQKKTLNFPGLSKEVAEWIVTYKNIVGVGVDVASVDPGSTTEYPAHKTFSKAGLYNMENVNLIQPVPEYGCTAIVMPMKIAQGTGAPLRLVAICPRVADWTKGIE